jgi:hypothetical protein
MEGFAALFGFRGEVKAKTDKAHSRAKRRKKAQKVGAASTT